jgi:hypothetical protein
MAEAERAGGGQNDMEKELTCSVSRGPAFLVLRTWGLAVRDRSIDVMAWSRRRPVVEAV